MLAPRAPTSRRSRRNLAHLFRPGAFVARFAVVFALRRGIALVAHAGARDPRGACLDAEAARKPFVGRAEGRVELRAFETFWARAVPPAVVGSSEQVLAATRAVHRHVCAAVDTLGLDARPSLGTLQSNDASAQRQPARPRRDAAAILILTVWAARAPSKVIREAEPRLALIALGFVKDLLERAPRKLRVVLELEHARGANSVGRARAIGQWHKAHDAREEGERRACRSHCSALGDGRPFHSNRSK